MKLAYLGPRIDHLDSLEIALRPHGLSLQYIADSDSWLREHPQEKKHGYAGRLDRIRSQFFGTSNPAYLRYALNLIDKNSVDTVIAYWGTLPLPDIRALRRLRPGVRFVLHLLCHPLALDRWHVRLQHLLVARGAPFLSGLIASTNFMRDYLHAEIPALRGVPAVVLPPCWPQSYMSAQPLSAPAAEANLLFMGRMDWKRAQPSDNVAPQLQAVMEQGIHLHFVRSGEFAETHAFGHAFDPVPLAQAADLAAPFDASLVAYNLDAAPVKDRFAVTVPDRLITSVCAGVPIAIPATGYDSCYEYLAPYEAVLRYDSIPHLATQLRDRERVRELRAMAHERRSLYAAEHHVPTLLHFLSSL